MNKDLVIYAEQVEPFLKLKEAAERLTFVGQNNDFLDSIKLGNYDYNIGGCDKAGYLSLTRYYGECINCPYHEDNGGNCDIDSERFKHEDSPCCTEFDKKLGNYSETYDINIEDIDDVEEFTDIEKWLLKFVYDYCK